MLRELRLASPVLLLALTALVLPACQEKEDDDDGTDGTSSTDGTTDTDGDGETGAPSGPVDADGDGFNEDEDCDDTRSDINPGAEETCNGEDDDCDDEIDEDVTTTWYTDEDGDGFGVDGTGVEACTPPEDSSDTAGDCNDESRDQYPGATEICGDGLVNDCGATEEAARQACPYEWPATTAGEDHRFLGESAYSYAGDAVAVGDATGDGLDDLLVGSPRENYDGASDSGAVFFIPGGSAMSGSTLTEVASSFAVGGPETELGTSVAVVPDINDDGIDDVVLGAGGSYGGVVGYVRVHYGSPDLDLRDPVDGRLVANLSEGVGESVAGLGDVDNDGLGDILVGHPLYTNEGSQLGAVYLLSGPALGSDIAPTAMWYSSRLADAYLGAAVAGVGDVDGDGLADMLMGAPYMRATESYQGGAFLVVADSEPSGVMNPLDAEASFYGDEEYDRLGGEVAGAGDMNGDGLDDVLIAADGVDSDAGNSTGAVYLFLGGASGSLQADEADAILVGKTEYQMFGTSLSVVDDLDDDGVDDVLVGEPGYYDEGPSDTGKVYAFSGGFSGVIDTDDALFVIEDATIGDGGGASVAGGDLNGDGLIDIAMGLPGIRDTDYYSGGVSLLFGGTAY